MPQLQHLISPVSILEKKYYPAYFTPKPPKAGKPQNQIFMPDFLKKLNDQLQQHLSDEKLNVQRLTRLIGMSRTDLHRKLSSTVGMSTTEYIRHFRLQRAAQLLDVNPEWTVHRVAMEVGFDNQSYFSRRFKEVFGVCPKNWQGMEEDVEQ